MNKLWFAASVALLSPHIAVADEWYVEAHYTDQAAIIRASNRFQHLDIDRDKQTVRVDTDEEGIRFLENAGFDVRIDMAATANLRAFYQSANSISSIPGYACYRTVEETMDSMEDIVEVHPTLAEIHEIGPSWERTQNPNAGYMMRALRITNLETFKNDPDRPRMVMFGSIHAREYTPAELLTRMAEWLVTSYGTDAQATWLVDHVDFRFILHANPDGRKKAESGISWRKNTNSVDAACSGTPNGSRQPGVDLNRNFPFKWGTAPGGSSSIPCDLIYRGPSAGSEIETRNLIAYVAGTPGADGVFTGGALPDLKTDEVTTPAPEDYPGIFFDMHSYSRLVLWPWSDVSTLPPNSAAYQAMGRRIAWFNNYTPQRAVQLYPTDGGTIDTFYGRLGAPSFVMEIGNEFFELCSSFETDVLPKNLGALKFAARAAKAPYKLGSGPDVHTLSLDQMSVEAGTPVVLTATIDDTRYRATSPVQTTYAITAAAAYIDTTPWDPNAVAIPMAPVDGTFNGKTEVVQLTIPTDTLAPGKHLIFVQGTNALGANGTQGAPDAVMLEILPPSNDMIFRDGFEGGTP
jgi:carboxypeptidase T